MDRNILESNPHQVIEGMIIAYAELQGTYIRAESRRQLCRLKAIQARKKGHWEPVMGSELILIWRYLKVRGFTVEETALISSMEGKMVFRASSPSPGSLRFYGNLLY